MAVSGLSSLAGSRACARFKRRTLVLPLFTMSSNWTRWSAVRMTIHFLCDMACLHCDHRSFRQTSQTRFDQLLDEWCLVCLAYNIKRYHTLSLG